MLKVLIKSFKTYCGWLMRGWERLYLANQQHHTCWSSFSVEELDIFYVDQVPNMEGYYYV